MSSWEETVNELASSTDNDSCSAWYAIRMPGASHATIGSGTAIPGLHPGFVIAPFDLSAYADSALQTIVPEEKATFHIPDNTSFIVKSRQKSIFPIPTQSTSKEEHAAEISAIQQSLAHSGYGKIVAARAIICNNDLQPGAIFSRMAHAYPNAFVFCCYTENSGILFGATPETLLSADGEFFHSMSLAGTRPANSRKRWDKKNIEEQAMVTEFICNAFRKENLDVKCGLRKTIQAGPVKHLCTPIKASIPSDFNNSLNKLLKFLKRLSPTPAVAGLPREDALEIINKYEHFNRGYYGGFCGLLKAPCNFNFFVNLRSGRIDEKRTVIFSGGGITSRSKSEDEWNETEIKASTLISLLSNPDSN